LWIETAKGLEGTNFKITLQVYGRARPGLTRDSPFRQSSRPLPCRKYSCRLGRWERYQLLVYDSPGQSGQSCTYPQTRAIGGSRIDVNLQGFIEGKTDNSPGIQKILGLSHCQDRQIPNGAEDCSVILGIVPANEKNMARPGLIGCLHRSDLDMPALWHHIFRQLNERVSEIHGAKQTQMYGRRAIGKYAVRPVNKIGKMSKKIRLRSISNWRFLLCPRGRGDEK